MKKIKPFETKNSYLSDEYTIGKQSANFLLKKDGTVHRCAVERMNWITGYSEDPVLFLGLQR